MTFEKCLQSYVLSNNNRQTSPPALAWWHVLIISLPWVQGQPGLYSKTLFQKMTNFCVSRLKTHSLEDVNLPPSHTPIPGALP